MVSKLERRFDKKDLVETLQTKFYHERQKVDEPLEEWAERVQRLGIEAFAELPESYMNRQIVLRFCQGCNDKETAQYASDKNPVDIEEALQVVKAHIQNNKAIYGGRKVVRRIEPDMSEEDDYGSVRRITPSMEEEIGDHLTYAVRAMSPRRNFHHPQKHSNIEHRLKSMEDNFSRQIEKMYKLLETKLMIDSSKRDNKLSTPPQSPKRVCYICQKPGHLSYDCPQNPQKRSLSPAKNTKENTTKVSFDLNTNRPSV